MSNKRLYQLSDNEVTRPKEAKGTESYRALQSSQLNEVNVHIFFFTILFLHSIKILCKIINLPNKPSY